MPRTMNGQHRLLLLGALVPVLFAAACQQALRPGKAPASPPLQQQRP